MGYDPALFVTNISDEFKCPICLKVFEEPVVGSFCDHIFCSKCILKWLKNSSGCPIDRRSMKKHSLHEAPRIVINLLNNFEMKCPLSTKGCCWILPLGDLSHHLSWCLFNDPQLCNTLPTTKSTSLSLATPSSPSPSLLPQVISQLPASLCSMKPLAAINAAELAANPLKQMRLVCDKTTELNDLHSKVEQLRVNFECYKQFAEDMQKEVVESQSNFKELSKNYRQTTKPLLRLFVNSENGSKHDTSTDSDDETSEDKNTQVIIRNLNEFMNESLLIEYLRQKSIRVIECETVSDSWRRSKDFRVVVPSSMVNQILSTKLWPRGVSLSVNTRRLPNYTTLGDCVPGCSSETPVIKIESGICSW